MYSFLSLKCVYIFLANLVYIWARYIVKLRRFSYIIGPKAINRNVEVARLPEFICGEDRASDVSIRFRPQS